jgi:DNA-binding transcriptional ArsR family regulator
MNDEQLDRIFKALADPTRRRIIDRLRERPGQSLFQICTISAATDGKVLSRQAISQHLDMLEKAGLLKISRVAQTKIHTLDLVPLRQAVEIWLARHLQEGNDA